MITTYKNYSIGSWASDGLRSYDMYGKSTDEKPVDVANASTFYEMDTKILYMFDAEGGVWLPQ